MDINLSFSIAAHFSLLFTGSVSLPGLEDENVAVLW